MKRYLIVTILIVASMILSAAGPEINPVGTWKVSYKIGGVPFSDYLTITGVLQNGKILAVDEWGNKVQGIYRNGAAIITGAPSDFYFDQYVIFPGDRGSRHIGIFAYYCDFTPSWSNATAVKTIARETMQRESRERKIEAKVEAEKINAF